MLKLLIIIPDRFDHGWPELYVRLYANVFFPYSLLSSKLENANSQLQVIRSENECLQTLSDSFGCLDWIQIQKCQKDFSLNSTFGSLLGQMLMFQIFQTFECLMTHSLVVCGSKKYFLIFCWSIWFFLKKSNEIKCCQSDILTIEPLLLQFSFFYEILVL